MLLGTLPPLRGFMFGGASSRMRIVNHGRELVATGALVSGSILCSIARTVHQQGLFEPDQLNGLGSALILNR